MSRPTIDPVMRISANTDSARRGGVDWFMVTIVASVFGLIICAIAYDVSRSVRRYRYPVTVKRVEYIPGGFANQSKTVLHQEDGSTIVLEGSLSVPKNARAVVVNGRGDFCCWETRH